MVACGRYGAPRIPAIPGLESFRAHGGGPIVDEYTDGYPASLKPRLPRPRVTSRNPVGDLREFAVVSHRFPLEGREGILAVLGPRRMPYQRCVTGIHTIRDGLRSLRGEERR